MSLELLRRVRVVLVRPSHPGNIGAAARAMQTMGLSQLVLVEPQRFPDPAAQAMAANATAVLDAARVCATLDEALAGTVLQAAFSARPRGLSHAAHTVREAAALWLGAAAQGDVALVFGNETYGLSNEEVMRCSRLAVIPTDAGSSSLNLAAAVQVAAYELRVAALAPGAGTGEGASTSGAGEPARHEDVERLYGHLEASLYGSGFLQPGNPRRLMERMRRLFGRAGLEVEEVNILRGMLTQWDLAGSSPGKAVVGQAAADPAAPQYAPTPILDKNNRK